ncbi:MAG: hypothetical protein M3R00_05460 [Pseudomonadota bacterium]|nr:hypothetical protein [Pseudomonadota bacterium]
MLSKNDNVSRISVIGDAKVGKTSLIECFGGEEMEEPAIVCDQTKSTAFRSIECNGKNYALHLFEVKDHMEFQVTSDFDVYLVVFDLTSLDSYRWMIRWIYFFEGTNRKIVIVGNKCDHKMSQAFSVDAKRYCESVGIPYIETSAIEKINVRKAFITALHEALKTPRPAATLTPVATISEQGFLSRFFWPAPVEPPIVISEAENKQFQENLTQLISFARFDDNDLEFANSERHESYVLFQLTEILTDTPMSLHRELTELFKFYKTKIRPGSQCILTIDNPIRSKVEILELTGIELVQCENLVIKLNHVANLPDIMVMALSLSHCRTLEIRFASTSLQKTIMSDPIINTLIMVIANLFKQHLTLRICETELVDVNIYNILSPLDKNTRLLPEITCQLFKLSTSMELADLHLMANDQRETALETSKILNNKQLDRDSLLKTLQRIQLLFQQLPSEQIPRHLLHKTIKKISALFINDVDFEFKQLRQLYFNAIAYLAKLPGETSTLFNDHNICTALGQILHSNHVEDILAMAETLTNCFGDDHSTCLPKNTLWGALFANKIRLLLECLISDTLDPNEMPCLYKDYLIKLGETCTLCVEHGHIHLVDEISDYTCPTDKNKWDSNDYDQFALKRFLTHCQGKIASDINSYHYFKAMHTLLKR